MMRAFSRLEKESFRRTQFQAMMDRCLIRHFTGESGENDFGNPVLMYSLPVESACGYQPSATDEVQAEAVTVNATFRLPVTLPMASQDQIELINIKGDPLEQSLKFEVIGQPARGPSGYVVSARRITNA